MNGTQNPSVDLGDPRTWGGLSTGAVSLASAVDALGRGIAGVGCKVLPGPRDLEGKHFILRYSTGVTRLLYLEPDPLTQEGMVSYIGTDPLTGDQWDFMSTDIQEHMNDGSIIVVPDDVVPLFTGYAAAHCYDRVTAFSEALAMEINPAGVL